MKMMGMRLISVIWFLNYMKDNTFLFSPSPEQALEEEVLQLRLDEVCGGDHEGHRLQDVPDHGWPGESHQVGQET